MRNRLRNLASDTMLYGFFTIVGRFIGFLLVPLNSNYLTKIEMGEMGFFFAIIPFINIILGFGMDSSFFRFYKKDDLRYSGKVFTHSFMTMMTMGLIISGSAFILAPFYAHDLTTLPNSVEIVRLTALIPLFDTMMVVPYALLRMKREVKKFSVIRFLLVVIAVTLNIVFVIGMRMGLIGVFYAQIIANITGVVIFFPIIKRYMVFEFDKKMFGAMLRFGLPTIPAAFSSVALQVADKPILKYLTDASQLAEYNVNYKLGIPMMMLVTMFEYAWKPFYLSHYEDKDAHRLFSRVLTYFTLLAAGMFLTISFFIEYIVRIPSVGGRFINPIFWNGLGIIPIVLGGYYFNGVFTNLAAGFNIRKRTEFLPIAFGIAAIINIAMNFIFIPSYGYWASAWATLVAYFFSALILYFFSRKVYPIKYEWKRLFSIIGITLAVYFLTNYITAGMPVSFHKALIKFGALASFFILLWIFKFFTPAEIDGIKKLFRRKKNSK